jgi:hypothetical protein
MGFYSLLHECHDALLALSDPHLLLLVHQWIETRDWSMDNAPTVAGTVENQVCLDLGYTVHVPGTGRQYPSVASFIEAENAVGPGYILSPPPAQELRVRLAKIWPPDFKRFVIVCAYQAPRPRNVPYFPRPDRAFLAWLVQAIRENRILDRARPRCLFYCLGYRLGILQPGEAPPPSDEAELRSQLTRVWQHYVAGLLRRLVLFPETETELRPLFLMWAARGMRDAQRSLSTNPALEIILLLDRHAPGWAQLGSNEGAPTTPDAILEQHLRLLLWERSP